MSWPEKAASPVLSVREALWKLTNGGPASRILGPSVGVPDYYANMKAEQVCDALGLDADMTVAELRARLTGRRCSIAGCPKVIQPGEQYVAVDIKDSLFALCAPCAMRYGYLAEQANTDSPVSP